MTNRSMELEIWGGDWGLPSIDIDSLQLLVYCKLSGAPIQVKIRNNPFLGTLPTFRHGHVRLHKLDDVIAYLQSKNFYVDHMLTARNMSEILAYSQLLKEKLYPGLQFVWWVDRKNSIGLTKAWYANRLWFPFNFYYPGYYEGQAKNFITALYGSLEENINTIETQVYSDAEKCLTLLSNRLGESKFFFGNQPSSLDAVIYSYLAPLLKAPFPNPTLQNHLKACSNLVSFVVRITQKYFPAISEVCAQLSIPPNYFLYKIGIIAQHYLVDPGINTIFQHNQSMEEESRTLSYEYEKKVREKAQEKSTNSSDFPHKKRNQFFAGLIAMLAMTVYAVAEGLVEIKVGEIDEVKEDNK